MDLHNQERMKSQVDQDVELLTQKQVFDQKLINLLNEVQRNEILKLDHLPIEIRRAKDALKNKPIDFKDINFKKILFARMK